MSQNLIDELDALFGKSAPRPKVNGKKPKASQVLRSNPAAEPIRFWQPEAVVLYTSGWRCTCGAEGSCAPQLFVREILGKQSRLRAIRHNLQFSHLPRMVEKADPVVIQDCPDCFTSTPFGHPQQLLPLGDIGEPLERFVEKIEAGLFAAEIAEAIGNRRMTTREYHTLSIDVREIRQHLIAKSEE